MGALSASHWLIVGLVIIVLFGSRRLGELGSGLGEGIRNFKKGIKGDDADPSVAPPQQLKDVTSVSQHETKA